MGNGGYNRISGKKTLALVTALIVTIIALSIISIFMLYKNSTVVTNSSYYEKPTPTNTPTPTIQTIPTFLERSGD
jgi:cell division protein FtsN